MLAKPSWKNLDIQMSQSSNSFFISLKKHMPFTKDKKSELALLMTQHANVGMLKLTAALSGPNNFEFFH